MAVTLPQTVGVREYAETTQNRDEVLGDSKVRYPSSFAVKKAIEELKTPELSKAPVDWTME
jgi:hypothetical protein